MLCRWHINKDVLSYARTRCPELGRREVEVDEEEVSGRIYKKGAIFDTDETIAFKDLYYRLLDSTTEDEFERHCKAVKKRSPTMAGYQPLNSPAAIQNMKKRWSKEITLNTNREAGGKDQVVWTVNSSR